MVTVTGIAVSRGFAAGPVFVHRPDDVQNVPEYEVSPDRVEAEVARYGTARAQTRAQIEALVAQLGAGGGNAAAVFANHLEILDDESLCRSVERLIRERRVNAEAAVRRTVAEFRAIFGGGRYDNLLTTIGGDPATAVGLGFGDVVVTELLKARLGADAPAPKKGVYVGWMFPEQRDAALKLAAKLRAQGECVNLALRKAKPKQFFSRAGASSCAKAVFLGPDDVAAGTAKMKDLATREETIVEL